MQNWKLNCCGRYKKTAQRSLRKEQAQLELTNTEKKCGFYKTCVKIMKKGICKRPLFRVQRVLFPHLQNRVHKYISGDGIWQRHLFCQSQSSNTEVLTVMSEVKPLF